MAEHANVAGKRCFCSNQTYAYESGFGLSTIKRALERLEAGAWIRKTHVSKGGVRRAGRNPTSTYEVLVLPELPAAGLTHSKRRAVLYPEDRQHRLRSGPLWATSNRSALGHKSNRPALGHK